MIDTSYQHTIWKRNLYTCWGIRCITDAGYQFLIPFIPLMIQTMGVRKGLLDVVSGIAISAPGLFLGLVAPFWGYVADRIGHKIMILRAVIVSAVLFFLFSITNSIGMFIVLRILQGLFTGVIASSIALVSTSTPQQHQNKALRTLATSNLLTSTFVPAVSGVIVLAVGISPSLRVGSLVVLVMGIITCFLIIDPTTKYQRKTMIAHHKQESLAGRKISYVLPAYTRVFTGTLLTSGLLNFLRIAPIAFALLVVLKFVPAGKQEVFSSILMGALGLWSLGSTYCVPYIANKTTKSRFSIAIIYTVCTGIVATAVLISISIIGYIGYFIVCALALGASSGVDVLMQEVFGKISYSEHKGKVFGKLTFVGGIGRFSGIMIVSSVSGWLGVTAASVFIIVLLSMIIAMLLYTRGEEKRVVDTSEIQ